MTLFRRTHSTKIFWERTPRGTEQRVATNKNEEKQTEALGFVVIEERKEDTSHTYYS